MNKPTRFDARDDTVGVSRNFVARLVAAQADPPIPVNGLTIGIAEMSENSPHGGEMHPDGDEILYMISGHARIVFEDSSLDDIEMHAGDGLVIPQGTWHRVDILAPCKIMYATPGPGGEYRPL